MATANFIGVYSSQTGSRRQNAGARKRYWFVWDDLRGGCIVQLLDASYKPVDEPRMVKHDEFNDRFSPEPTIYVSPLSRLEVPDFEEMPPGTGYPASSAGTPVAERRAGLLDMGDQRAEHEDGQASELDLELRSEFALALARLQRGEKASAVNTFEKIAARRDGIIPAHKHMFTDFGVYLRKGQLHSVAFKFYQRALELAPEDSNAYFNMARIMFDLGDYEGSEQHLQQALHLDNTFDEARRFLDFVVQNRSSRAGGKTSGKTSGKSARQRGKLDPSLFSMK